MASKKFTHTKPITKANIANVPGNKPGIYRIKNASGKILYVGKAKGGRLDERITEHKGGGHKFSI